MLCDICHKNKASIHITEIINDEAKELHLCQHCAETESIKMQQSFGISDLLSGLVDFPDIMQKDKTSRCHSCGMTYDDFKRLGKLGCSECYATFSKMLMPLIKNIHGSVQHIGKEPKKKPGIKKQAVVGKSEPFESKAITIDALKEKLKRAITAEEYEKAAILRDEIKALEKANENK